MLNEAQRQTLLDNIAADPELSQLDLEDFNSAITIAQHYNAPSDPPFWVYKTAFSMREFLENGVDWVEVGGLNQQRDRILDRMLWLGEVDTSKYNVRKGFNRMLDNSPDTVESYIVLRSRPASRLEALFAIDGSDPEDEPPADGSPERPATATVTGTIHQDYVWSVLRGTL